jgi:NAD(P)-dependent dehydrogenase (short-subunit alcohol dehydrogenase family)
MPQVALQRPRIGSSVCQNINNLGISEPMPFEQISDSDWMRFFEVNVLSGATALRLRGVGICNAFGRSASIIVPLLIGPLFTNFGIPGRRRSGD